MNSSRPLRTLLLGLLVSWPLPALAQLAAFAPEDQDRSTPEEMTGKLLIVAVILLVLASVAIALQIVMPKRVRVNDAARNDPRRQPPEARTRQLGELRERDPSFVESEFLAQARRTFLAISRAREDGDPRLVSGLVSDGTLRRFLTEAAVDRSAGTRTVTGDVQLIGCELIAADCDAGYDVLHVAMTGSHRVAQLPADASAAPEVARRGKVVELDEVWSFVRRLSAGGGKGHLADGKCPSCGAPVERAAVTSCEHCRAILNSGEHDWVLAGVREGPEFFCRLRASIPRWPELRARDAELHRTVLEDRAALVFWKWVEALVTGTPKRFARLCSPATLDHLEESNRRLPAFRRIELTDLYLAEVEPSAERDRAHFVLSWRTGKGSWDLPRKSVLSLERRAEVRARRETGLATDRCHACGGAQQEVDAVTCAWCGAVLPNDWAFVDCLPIDEFYLVRHAADAQLEWLSELVGDATSPREAARLMALMVAMVRADGEVRPGERQLLQRCAARWHVAPAQLEELLQLPLQTLVAVRPEPAGARRALRGLVAAALVDGGVGKSEKVLLNGLAEVLKLPVIEVDAAVADASAALETARRASAEG